MAWVARRGGSAWPTFQFSELAKILMIAVLAELEGERAEADPPRRATHAIAMASVTTSSPRLAKYSGQRNVFSQL